MINIKYIPIFLILILSNALLGQDNSDYRKWALGINFSPDICGRKLKNTDGSPTADFVIKMRNDNETLKLSYSAGLNICYYFNESFALESGLQYANKGFQTVQMPLNFTVPNPSDPVSARVVYNFHYLDIPLKSVFLVVQNRIKFIGSAGIVASILMKADQKVHTEYGDGRIDKQTYSQAMNFKRINVSPLLSTGVDIELNPRTHLRIEPTFRYGILKTTDTPVVEYLWSAGLNLGCYLNL